MIDRSVAESPQEVLTERTDVGVRSAEPDCEIDTLNSMSSNNHANTQETGAVVIGGDYQGLGIVRSLGRKGVPVGVIDDESSISRFSRYTQFSVKVPDLRTPEGTVKSLLELGRTRRLQGWVLFPTRDEIVATLSQHREALSEVFRVPTPQWETIRWAWDKRNTYDLAKKLDIPIPQTWVPRSAEELDRIETPFPVALKPAIKEHFFYATKAKAWRATNKTELREMFEQATSISAPGEVIIQEIVPGKGECQFAYGAFFTGGKAVGSMVVRRRRQHPHDFGRASTYVETVEVPGLEDLAVRFLKAIDYSGLVEVEFKQDPRDGVLKLLDVNARTWGYHSLGATAGVDFPYLLFSSQMGADVPQCTAKAGIKWVRLLTDFPTGISDVFHGRITSGEFFRTLRTADTEAVFSFKDPLPGLVECALLPYLAIKRGF
jgi:D-aspartate ligase